MKLTKEQIDTVVSWLESYETLRLTSIPMRFREDFSEKPPVKEYYLKKDLPGVKAGAKVKKRNSEYYSIIRGEAQIVTYFTDNEVENMTDWFGVVGSAEGKSNEPKCNCKTTENINGEDIIIIVGNNPKSDIKEALEAMDRFFKDGKKS